MFFSRIASPSNLKPILVQRYSSAVLLQPWQSSRRKCLSKLSQRQSGHQQISRWKSEIPAYLEKYVALESLKDAVKRKHDTNHVMSSCSAVEQLVKRTSNITIRDLHDVMSYCANLSTDESAVTSLVASALDTVAEFPVQTWLNSANQIRLRWISYNASKCRCSTQSFREVIQQNIRVQSINKPEDIRQCASALRNLNIVNKRIAEELMHRFLAVSPIVYQQYYHRDMLHVILYCALSGVDCSVLTSRTELDLLIKDFNPKMLQLALLLTSLRATDQQQDEIDRICSDNFNKTFNKRFSTRCCSLMSYLIGEEYAIGGRQISGVDVQAAVILSPSLKPLNPLTQCASDVLTDTSIDMRAAQRHGLHVVAAIGYSNKNFLRHPRAPGISGRMQLEVLALQTLGCWTIPVRLESQLNGPQTQFEVIPQLLFNFPSHLPPFSHYVTRQSPLS